MILFEALMITLTAHFLRYMLRNRILPRYQNISVGVSILIGLFLVHSFFHGVNLSFMGILVLYLGAVLLEMILPDPACVRTHDIKGN